MAYIERIVFRHLHAIRHQVNGALGMTFKSMLQFDFREWLCESAPELLNTLDESSFGDFYLSHKDKSGTIVQNYAMILNSCLMNYEMSQAQQNPLLQRYFKHSIVSTSASDHAAEDYYGTELGGEWNIPNFIVRSGIVLSLGALEEFERGTLRILFAHGSQSLPTARTKLFFPRLSDYHQQSEEWMKAERTQKTFTIKGRRKLLESFSIYFDGASEYSQRLHKIRNDRNAIAHGYAAVTHPFQAFLQLHYDIFQVVQDMSNQCKILQKIVL